MRTATLGVIRGWWLVRATLLERSRNLDLDWESHFTTLTIFVGAK
jgi:hypothetical protein